MANWKMGASSTLPIADSARSWDGPAALRNMLDAGTATARRGTLAYDADADPTTLIAYKLQFADLVDGKLQAIPSGLRAAASRLPQANIPQSVKDDARTVLDGYFAKLNAQKSAPLLLDVRAGRVLSGVNEKKLREALSIIGEVLAQLGDEQNSLRSQPHFEERTFPFGRIEVREDAGQTSVRGHAAPFNSLSVFLYGFREQIAPGAFADSLQNGDIRALWQHDAARVLGRTTAGTLKLWEDDQGLAFELNPPDTQDGRDAVTLIKRGDVNQMSFGFTTPMGGDSWAEDDTGMPIRTLNKVNLLEISPVTWPAYPETGITVVRSAPDWVQRALCPGANDNVHADDPTRARDDLLRRMIRIKQRR